MSTVKVDKEVLRQTAEALTTVATDLPGILTAADELGVGSEVGQLRTAPTWSSETAVDLRARIGLIERMEDGNGDFRGFEVSRAELEQMAGASMPVDEQLYALEGAEIARDKGESVTSWDGEENFQQWIEGMAAKAIAHLPLLGDKGEVIEQGIHAFNEYQDLLKAGGMSAIAVSQLGKTQIYSLLFKVTTRYGDMGQDALRARGLLNQARWLERGIQAIDNYYLAGRRTLTAPGTTLPWLKGQAVRYVLQTQHFDEMLAAARASTTATGQASLTARMLAHPFVSQNVERLSTLLGSGPVSRLANLTGTVFGRPWTTMLNGQQVVVARNATNLATVLRADGLRQSMKVAGGLRVLGIAGSAFATADSGLALYNSIQSGELAESWNEGGAAGKAKVIGDISEVAFNASLTAAMVAPNPVTWGAVAVTGIVYGGARLVEHWDDVTAALDTAKDWAGDRLEDAGDWAEDRVDDVKEGFGDAVDAVKESDLNPANWF